MKTLKASFNDAIFEGAIYWCLRLSNWILFFIGLWVNIKNFKSSVQNIFSLFKNTVGLFQKNIEIGKKYQGICKNSKGYFSQSIFVTSAVITKSNRLHNLSTNLRNLEEPLQLIRQQVRDHYALKFLRISFWIQRFLTSVTSLRFQRIKKPAITL